MSTPRFRTALIGAGNVGARFAEDPKTALHFAYATHAQVLAAHPAFSWDAVVDRSPTNLAAAKARWGVGVGSEDLKGLRGLCEPEVAVLATPPQGRMALLDDLPELRAVVVEKPLGLTLKEAEAFVDACRGRGVVMQVNLWRRADRAVRELADGGLARRIGTVQGATLVYGNGLRNNGSHMVDLVRMLLGEVVAAQALGKPVASSPLAGDVNVDFALHVRGGVTVAALALDFQAYRENAMEVWGTEGRLTIDLEGLRIVHAGRQSHRAVSGASEVASDAATEIPSGAGDALYHLYSNLADALGGGSPLWSPGDEALQTERIMESIVASASQGGRRVAP